MCVVYYTIHNNIRTSPTRDTLTINHPRPGTYMVVITLPIKGMSVPVVYNTIGLSQPKILVICSINDYDMSRIKSSI